MRIEQSNAGVYRIRPIDPVAPPPQQAKAAPNAATHPAAAEAPPSIDTVEISSIDFKTASASLPNEARVQARLRNLAAGVVNRPVTFDDQSAPSSGGDCSPNALLDRAYFRRTANHAGLNTAALERRLNELA